MPETSAAKRQRNYREKQRSEDPDGFKKRIASYKRDLRRRKTETKEAADPQSDPVRDHPTDPVPKVESTRHSTKDLEQPKKQPKEQPKEYLVESTRHSTKDLEQPKKQSKEQPKEYLVEPDRQTSNDSSRFNRSRHSEMTTSETLPVLLAATASVLPKGSVEPARITGCEDLEQKIRERRDQMKIVDPSARAPTDGTIRAQFNRVRLLFKQMHGRTFACRDWQWTRDTKKVLKFIETNPRWTTEASRNTHRAALAAILRNMLGFEETAHIYGHETTLANHIIQKQVGENNLKGSARANYLDWESLARKVMRVPRGTIDSALTAIYTFAPPRRLADYCAIRIIVGISDDRLKALDPSGNYLSVNRHMTPGDWCFNVYKTSASLGQQIIAVHPHVVPLLKEYILRDELKDGDLLFPDYRGRPYTNFSRFVAQTFERWTGKPVSVDLLRHAFITMSLARRPTLNERRQLAWEMGHSLSVQATYEVLDPHLEPTQR
jgi:integrase